MKQYFKLFVRSEAEYMVQIFTSQYALNISSIFIAKSTMQDNTMRGTIQIKKKRGWGDPQAWNTEEQQGGGWGGQQQQGGNFEQIGAQLAGFFGGLGGNPQAWGNQFSGHKWIQNQKKQQQFDIQSLKKVDIADFIEQQIIQLECSPAQKIIKELRQKGQTFRDKRFPPNTNSLCGEWGQIADWSTIEWAKISEKFPQAKIFTHKPNPRDIKQGDLGDCYFLAGLAALAERPDRIYNLFLTNKVNDVKYYSCKILYKGKWMIVDMDEYIPFAEDSPAFSKSTNNQLWVMLLEKAWAKIYTSYKRTEAGYNEEPLHDLTGAPIKQIKAKKGANMEEEWQYLYRASQLQYSMNCSSNSGSDKDKSKSGVVQGHAYTLMKVDYLNFKGQKIKLAQLRNPWGEGEFEGAWSDHDQIWNQVDQNEKKRIGFNPNKDDGIFFIPWEIFWKEFQEITIAEIDDNASYVYKSHPDKKKQGCYFQVAIKKEGLYSLQVDKTPERSFEDKRQSDYYYPNATVEIGLLQGGGVQNLQGFSSEDRMTFKKYNLQPGTYVVKVQIDFDQAWEKDYDVNLAVYAQYPCIIKLATNQQACALAGQQVNWLEQEKEPAQHVWNHMTAWGQDEQQDQSGNEEGDSDQDYDYGNDSDQEQDQEGDSDQDQDQEDNSEQGENDQ